MCVYICEYGQWKCLHWWKEVKTIFGHSFAAGMFNYSCHYLVIETLYLKSFSQKWVHTLFGFHNISLKYKTLFARTHKYISSVFASIKANDVYILWFMYSLRLRASNKLIRRREKKPTHIHFVGGEKFIGSYFFIHSANAIDDERAYFCTYQLINIIFFFVFSTNQMLMFILLLIWLTNEMCGARRMVDKIASEFVCLCAVHVRTCAGADVFS